MILSDKMISQAISNGDIVISPFDPSNLGSNSYDVHLGDTLMTYTGTSIGKTYVDIHDTVGSDVIGLDCKIDNPIISHKLDAAGYVLFPGRVYLGVTMEYTETRKYVPFCEGKSSVARLGMSLHCTAGKGDVNFFGHFTLEIHVLEPLRVYPGMPVGQLIYFDTGDVAVPYDAKPSAKYNNKSPLPQSSMMWKNFI